MITRRLLRGEVRHADGRDWIVLRTHREHVVAGVHVGDGVAYARETRDSATVRAWPQIGRMRVSPRDAGGWYVAPWKGRMAASERLPNGEYL